MGVLAAGAAVDFVNAFKKSSKGAEASLEKLAVAGAEATKGLKPLSQATQGGVERFLGRQDKAISNRALFQESGQALTSTMAFLFNNLPSFKPAKMAFGEAEGTSEVTLEEIPGFF